MSNEKTFLKLFSNLSKDIFERFKDRDFYGAFFALTLMFIVLLFFSLLLNFLKKDSVSIYFFIGIIVCYIVSIIALYFIEKFERQRNRKFDERLFLNYDENFNNYKIMLTELLNNVRNEVITNILKTNNYDLIRANIFIPQEFGKNGYIYQLKRPEALKIPKNKHFKDDDIFFIPNEGITGEVFENGLSNYTKDRFYNICKEKHSINENLQWIVSFAIKFQNNTIAVLNIDCIDENFKDFDLNKILNNKKIKEYIENFSKNISKNHTMYINLARIYN